VWGVWEGARLRGTLKYVQCTSDSESAGDYLLFWAKQIMGHFLGLFEGPLNFLFCFDNEKKYISRTFRISGTFIVMKFVIKGIPQQFFLHGPVSSGAPPSPSEKVIPLSIHFTVIYSLTRYT
jgi:hypothetical protein